jgi:DNA-binding LacI/PurR family transcriptional regulator
LLSAAYESGLKVGHSAECDLRVAGHDDHPFSRYTCPSLTTIAQDYDAIGERSVSEMLKIIDGANGIAERSEELFEGRLVMRSSA